jgi:hypothetical protein
MSSSNDSSGKYKPGMVIEDSRDGQRMIVMKCGRNHLDVMQTDARGQFFFRLGLAGADRYWRIVLTEEPSKGDLVELVAVEPAAVADLADCDTAPYCTEPGSRLRVDYAQESIYRSPGAYYVSGLDSELGRWNAWGYFRVIERAQKAAPMPKMRGNETASLDRLLEATKPLGPNALRLLADIAERLAKGAREHGDFETARDWDKEAREEDLDGIVYRVLAMQAARR